VKIRRAEWPARLRFAAGAAAAGLERRLGGGLLCGVSPPDDDHTLRSRATTTVAGIVAAATTGALVAIGRRLGHAGIPFAAIGAAVFRGGANRASVGLVFCGVVLHVAAMFVWSAVAVWLARRERASLFVAVIVATANFFASWLLAWSRGAGLASELTLGDRLSYAVVLAASLVVGMRYAFLHRRETATTQL